MYIPKINLPVEGVEHARWLERRSIEQEKLNAEFRRFMDRMGREQSTSARQSATLTASPSGGGLPAGGPTSSVLRKSGPVDGAARWSTEWQGLMPEYWVTLSDGNPSYTVSGLGLSAVEVDDIAKTLALLPRVSFDDDGRKMLPFYQSSFPDALGGTSGSGQTPIYLNVSVVPTFNGETFTIVLPSDDNLIGATTPFYTVEVRNDTGFDASVEFDGPTLFYAGTTAPVYGGATFTLPAGVYAAWFVMNVKGHYGLAVPAPGFAGDAYFDQHVRGTADVSTFTREGVLSVATGGLRLYNDRPMERRFGPVVRASVGTAPTGAALIVDVLMNGSSILTAPLSIAAGTNTATASTDSLYWLTGDYITYDVTQVGSSTPGSDLTVQVWAG